MSSCLDGKMALFIIIKMNWVRKTGQGNYGDMGMKRSPSLQSLVKTLKLTNEHIPALCQTFIFVFNYMYLLLSVGGKVYMCAGVHGAQRHHLLLKGRAQATLCGCGDRNWLLY